MHAKIGPARAKRAPGAVGGAVGERVQVADRYGAVELGAKGGSEVRLRCAGAQIRLAHDVVAHERGRWC